MARYEIQSPDGRTMVIEGDSPPTDADLDELFSSMPNENSDLISRLDTSNIIKPEEREMGISDFVNKDVALAGLKGLGTGAERLLSGATLGGYDWASDKLGLGATERKKELEGTGIAGNVAGGGLEIVGSLFPSAKIAQGTGALLSKAPKIAKYAAAPLVGALEGGIYGGFKEDSLEGAGKGALLGGVTSGALGGLTGLGRKLFSSDLATKGLKGGLSDAVYDKKGARLLTSGVRADDSIAERLLKEAPDSLSEINQRTATSFDRAIGDRVDIPTAKAEQSALYKKFISDNADMPVIPIDDLGKMNDDIFEGLNTFQKKKLAEAFERGGEKTLSPRGSLDFVNKAKQELNDMIDGSKITSIKGEKSTSDTVNLLDVKSRVDDLLLNSGLKDVDAGYSEVMKLQNAYDMGLTYNPKSIKTGLNLKTDAEKKAFAEGILEKATINPDIENVSDVVLKNRKALRYALPEKEANDLIDEALKNKSAYDKINSLGKQAEKKLGTPEGSRMFLREQMESTGSTYGALADYLIDKMRGGLYTKSAEKLLDPSFIGRSKPTLTNPLIPALGAFPSDILRNEKDEL